MKRSILALFFLLPLNAFSSPPNILSSELTNVIAINNTIAGVVWDLKASLLAFEVVIQDPNPNDNKFYAPTVLFLKAGMVAS